MTGSLRLNTLKLLETRPANLDLLTIACATDLPLPWLRCFLRAKNPGSSVDRVQKLYEYLSGKPLFSADNV